MLRLLVQRHHQLSGRTGRQFLSQRALHGEKAQGTGDFYCASCSEKVHVEECDKILSCSNGHKEFETRRNEPGNKF
ncbi:hypothetical protein GCM10010279_23540 [Streptomyces mutabilis]|nr:hypothetical protein GCM10010279_23540 [Streptomyces mutabilis]